MTTPTKPTLELARRLCKLGSNINGRTEKHGDQDVPAADVPIVGLMLEASELCALLGDARAHESLFRKNESGTFEPIFAKHFKPLKLQDRFKDATVCLYFNGAPPEASDENDLELVDVTLANLELDPQVGGLTALEVQVQTRADVDEIATLYAHMGAQIHAWISFGKRAEKASRKQQSLPLGNDTEPEADDRLALCQYVDADEIFCGEDATAVVDGRGACDEHAQLMLLKASSETPAPASGTKPQDAETLEQYVERRKHEAAQAAMRGEMLPADAPGADLPSSDPSTNPEEPPP